MLPVREVKNEEYKDFNYFLFFKLKENHEVVKVRQPVVFYENLNVLDLEIFLPEYIVLQIQRGFDTNPEVIFSKANKLYPIKLKEFSAKAQQNTQT